jgi:hypothetical protein
MSLNDLFDDSLLSFSIIKLLINLRISCIAELLFLNLSVSLLFFTPLQVSECFLCESEYAFQYLHILHLLLLDYV